MRKYRTCSKRRRMPRKMPQSTRSRLRLRVRAPKAAVAIAPAGSSSPWPRSAPRTATSCAAGRGRTSGASRQVSASISTRRVLLCFVIVGSLLLVLCIDRSIDRWVPALGWFRSAMDVPACGVVLLLFVAMVAGQKRRVSLLPFSLLYVGIHPVRSIAYLCAAPCCSFDIYCLMAPRWCFGCAPPPPPHT